MNLIRISDDIIRNREIILMPDHVSNGHWAIARSRIKNAHRFTTVEHASEFTDDQVREIALPKWLRPSRSLVRVDRTRIAKVETSDVGRMFQGNGVRRWFSNAYVEAFGITHLYVNPSRDLPAADPRHAGYDGMKEWTLALMPLRVDDEINRFLAKVPK